MWPVTQTLLRQPRMRFTRISLRALMALVLITGGGLSWIVHRAQVQRNAVAAIEEGGGRVSYEWEWDVNALHAVPNGKPRWPKWFVDWVGADYIGNVVNVELRDVASDRDLIHVVSLSHLRGLRLGGLGVTDAGLAHLRELPRLASLSLAGTAITDDALEQVAALSQLRHLELSDNAITDRGLAHLKRLKNLEALGLDSTSISDAGLAQLTGMTRLYSLSPP